MFFVKYSKGKYLQDIIDGYIRFAPIFTYREFEKDAYENGIADPYDGMGRITANDLTYILEDDAQKTIRGKITMNVDLDGMDKIAVFCLSQYESVEDMRNHYKIMLEKFPETTHVLIIHTPDTFAKDIQNVLPMVGGGTVRYGQVKYPPQKESDMWQQTLFKSKQYTYQKEFRFVITNSSFGVPDSFKFKNHSKMTLLAVGDIEHYISENIDKEIEVIDCADKVLVKESDIGVEKVGVISELRIEKVSNEKN